MANDNCPCGALALLPDIHHAALTCHECIWHDSTRCDTCQLHDSNCEVAAEGLAPGLIAEIEGYLYAEAQMWEKNGEPGP